MEYGKDLGEYMGLEILLWPFLNNSICYSPQIMSEEGLVLPKLSMLRWRCSHEGQVSVIVLVMLGERLVSPQFKRIICPISRWQDPSPSAWHLVLLYLYVLFQNLKGNVKHTLCTASVSLINVAEADWCALWQLAFICSKLNFAGV